MALLFIRNVITLMLLFFCLRLIKPQTFADCVGNELPLGWEEAYDSQVGPFYTNHISRKITEFVTLDIDGNIMN